MEKKFGAWILSLLLTHFLVSCTSSKKEDGGDSVAGEIASEADDLETADSDEESFDDGDEDEADDGEYNEVASNEDDGEEDGEFDEEEAVEDELAAVEDEDEEDWEDEEPAREVAQSEATEVAPTQIDEATTEMAPEQPAEVVTSEPIETMIQMESPEVVDGPKWIPLKKIASHPFSKNGTLLNSVYIMREGDTLQSVSQKIYGGDRTSEILAHNPHLNSSTKPGNKLYYNSPTRSTDSTKMLTYYEDKGIPSEVYMTKEGDNIREFSAGLLGFPDAWKEVWATNENVESKQFVEPGLSLRYWKEGAIPLETTHKLASTETTMEESTEGGMSPEEFGGGDSALPPSHGKEGDPNMVQPPVAATTTLPPPPPPPPPPPLPPELPANRTQPQASVSGDSSLLGGDSMNYILLIVGCVALLGAGAFAIQKKNRKNLDFEYTTQA